LFICTTFRQRVHRSKTLPALMVVTGSSWQWLPRRDWASVAWAVWVSGRAVRALRDTRHAAAGGLYVALPL
jgi:hypothetical protein